MNNIDFVIIFKIDFIMNNGGIKWIKSLADLKN